jgi:predicted nucleotidyltransferase component of viral defense system
VDTELEDLPPAARWREWMGRVEAVIFASAPCIQVKIEVNFVMRGTVHPVRKAALTAKAGDTLLTDLEIPVVSLEDMYGGKLVAAMDRQHPRDLFDVMQLFAHEGITPGIRRAFVVYREPQSTGARGLVSVIA